MTKLARRSTHHTSPQRFGLGSMRAAWVLLAALLIPGAGSAASNPKLDNQQPAPPDAGVPSNRVPTAAPVTWPDTSTDAPSSQEWHGAEAALPTRSVGVRASNCRVRRVREWASIRCFGMPTSAITQLGGMQKGVSFHLDPPGEDRLPREGVLVFPLRRGDRRVFSFWTLGDGYDGPLTVIPAVVVQADWQGEHPALLLHDALSEPVRTARGERRKQEK